MSGTKQTMFSPVAATAACLTTFALIRGVLAVFAAQATLIA